MPIKKLILSCVLLASALPLVANAQSNEAELEAEGARIWQMLPRASQMIRHPGAEGWKMYVSKQQSELEPVDQLPGGQAKPFTIMRVGKNVWDAGANAKTQVKVKKGDVIVGAFWLRATSMPEGTSELRLPIHLQQMGKPYKQFSSGEAVVTSAWNQYFIHSTMPQKQSKGTMGLAVHLGGQPQSLEFGPVYLMNMGKGEFDPTTIPKSTYSGS